MADIFISYAREDKAFVMRLSKSLQEHDRMTWVDWEGISPSAEWMKEIKAAIESADTFVFVVSPSSINSAICRKELEHAVDHHKRLVPVVWQDTEAKEVPEALVKFHWIFFRLQDDFTNALNLLMKALDTDLEWTRTHTRLLVRAKEWEAHGNDDSFLLRGIDLQHAITWLTQADSVEHPTPTALHLDYIEKSKIYEANEVQRWKELYETAEARRQEAETQRLLAERQKQMALANSLLSRAQFLRVKKGASLEHCALLALESLFRNPSGPAFVVLVESLARLPKGTKQIFSDKIAIKRARFVPNSHTLVSFPHRSHAPLIWNADTGKHLNPSTEETRPSKGSERLDGLLEAMGDWEQNSGQQELPSPEVLLERMGKFWMEKVVPKEAERSAAETVDTFFHFPSRGDIIFDPSVRFVATNQCGADNELQIFDLETGDTVGTVVHGSAIQSFAFNPDGETLISTSEYEGVKLSRIIGGHQVENRPSESEENTLSCTQKVETTGPPLGYLCQL